MSLLLNRAIEKLKSELQTYLEAPNNNQSTLNEFFTRKYKNYFIIDYLSSQEILLLLPHCNTAQQTRLATSFIQYSEYERNQVVLQFYHDTKTAPTPEVWSFLKDKVSPAVLILIAIQYSQTNHDSIAKYEPSSLSTDEKEALLHLANCRFNQKISFYLNKNVPKTAEQSEIEKAYNTLAANEKLRHLLPVITEPTVIVNYHPDQIASDISTLASRANDHAHLHNRPGKIKRASEFDSDLHEDMVNLFKPVLYHSIFETPTNAFYLSRTLLGAGGYGVVKVAQNLFTQAWYAIKICEYSPNDSTLAKIARNAVYNLRNQNLLIDEGIIVNGNRVKHYYIIPYVPGVNLINILFQDEILNPLMKLYRNVYTLKQAVPFLQKLTYAIKIIQRVKEEHDLGRIIRDIKSSNILVTKDDLQLIDRDTISPADANSQFCTSMGYIAPEMINNIQSPETDLFALGATLCDIFTSENAEFDSQPDFGKLFFTSETYLAKKPDDALEKIVWQVCKQLTAAAPNDRGKLDVHLQQLNLVKTQYTIIDGKIANKLNSGDFKEVDNILELTQIYTRLKHDQCLTVEKVQLLKTRFMQLAYQKTLETAGRNYSTIKDFRNALIAIQKDAINNGYHKVLSAFLNHHRHTLLHEYKKWRGYPEEELRTTTYRSFVKANTVAYNLTGDQDIEKLYSEASRVSMVPL